MAWWLFQHLVTTTALAAAVALICRTVRIGPAARHALWVIVLIKFVLPPVVVWPWAAPDPLGLAEETIVESHLGDAERVALARGNESGDADPITAQAAMPVLATDAAQPLLTVNATWLLWIWAAGTLCVLVVEIARLTSMARQVRRAPEAPREVRDRVAMRANELGLRDIEVRITAAGSPAVWGFGRPRLLWPEGLDAHTSDAGLDGVIVHELAHVKRRDHLVAWIELAGGALWWWNPLFWRVRAARREQAELACDAWVLATLPDGRRAYAESLLAISSAGIAAQTTRAIAVTGFGAGSRRALERRLVMIMKGRARRRLPLAGVLSLTMIAAATLPAWATQNPPPPPPPPAPPHVVAIAPPAPPPPPVQASTPQAPRPRTRPVRTPPLPRVVQTMPPTRRYTVSLDPGRLPEDGRQLVAAFTAERTTIQQEANNKITQRREALIKTLQDLQEKYTKEGRLDEAVAIRDFLARGGPGGDFDFRFSNRR